MGHRTEGSCRLERLEEGIQAFGVVVVNTLRIGQSVDDLCPTAGILISSWKIIMGIGVLTLHFRGRPLTL